MTSHSLYAVVPAAGIGARMGAHVPKQYLLLNHHTILQHTLSKLVDSQMFKSIVVPVATGDIWFDKQPVAHSNNVKTCLGGSERFESVLKGLISLAEQGANDDDWVMVHDVARPCIKVSDLNALWEQRSNQGAILGLEVRDTMKRTDTQNSVIATVDRNRLWHALTPQLAPLGVLREAIEYCIEKGIDVTDEASALEHVGLSPKIVPGHPSNIKVTRPEDLELATFFLSQD